jgi:hypothetical protein
MKKLKHVVTRANGPGSQVTATEPASSSQDKSLAQETLDPTTVELASIAATLGRTPGRDFSRLAQNALELWEACRQEIARRRAARHSPFDELLKAIPQPKGMDVPLDEFLRLLLPRRRVPEKIATYRRFLMDWKGVPIEEAADLLAQHKQKPEFVWEYRRRAHVFQKWLAADFTRSKRMNGLKAQKHLTKKRLETERRTADMECRQAAANAEAYYREEFFRNNPLLGLC